MEFVFKLICFWWWFVMLVVIAKTIASNAIDEIKRAKDNTKPRDIDGV